MQFQTLKACRWIQKLVHYLTQPDCCLRTRGSGPLTCLEKTKANKKPVQGMEFSIHLPHRSFGRRRRHDTCKNESAYTLQTRLHHRKPLSVHSVPVFCEFKSILLPSTDVSPLIPILIKGYVQSQSSKAHAMTQRPPDATSAPVRGGLADHPDFLRYIRLQGLGSSFPCPAS